MPHVARPGRDTTYAFQICSTLAIFRTSHTQIWPASCRPVHIDTRYCYGCPRRANTVILEPFQLKHPLNHGAQEEERRRPDRYRAGHWGQPLALVDSYEYCHGHETACPAIQGRGHGGGDGCGIERDGCGRGRK